MKVSRKPKKAFHPGYYIREYLLETKISVNEFAGQLDLPTYVVLALLQNYGKVTPDIAEKLEKRIGVSAETWLNLQRAYDDATS